jgi:hypothetical protein
LSVDRSAARARNSLPDDTLSRPQYAIITKQYDKRLAEKKEQLKGTVSMDSGVLAPAASASAAAGGPSKGEGGDGEEETAPAAPSPSSGQRQQRMRKV